MLVQLVCLDRRYQRMNCYNIREIQTILKSKYTPNTVDSSDVRFSLNDTTIGLRYQLGGLDFINNSFLTYYQNTLVANSPYATIHTLLNKPLMEFKTMTTFMNKASTMYLTLTQINSRNSSILPTNSFFGVPYLNLFSEVVGSTFSTAITAVITSFT